VDTVPAHHRARAPLAAALCTLAALLAGCAAGRVVDGVYENPTTGFRMPVPPAPWVAVSIPDVEAAFRHPSAAGTIAVFSGCEAPRRAPLRVLARRLFFGLKEREVEEETPVSLDGAEALRTVMRADQDGTPVVVESVMVRRGACVYDLVLAAPPAAYPALRADFERMTAGWKPLP
jgi:hypothetical protein